MADREREPPLGATEPSDGERQCQPPPGRGGDLDPERVLQSSSRRRAMVVGLIDADGPQSLVALAASLSSDSQCTTCPDVYLELYERHLPVLEAAGIVEYDREEGVVALAESSERVTGLLERSVQDATV